MLPGHIPIGSHCKLVPSGGSDHRGRSGSTVCFATCLRLGDWRFASWRRKSIKGAGGETRKEQKNQKKRKNQKTKKKQKKPKKKQKKKKIKTKNQKAKKTPDYLTT